MRREFEILHRERETETCVRFTSSPMTIASQNSTMRLQPKALSELLSEFSGAEDTFQIWKKQFDLIRVTYQLDDGMARILIEMRLKQNALQWFHSRLEHLEISVDELIDKMRIMFDHRPMRMDLRKKFEEKTWCSGETFSNYFFNKTILANKISVDEDELIDYIIDGISDETIRNQARIQRFKRKEDLLKTFEKVVLRVPNESYARQWHRKQGRV